MANPSSPPSEDATFAGADQTSVAGRTFQLLLKGIQTAADQQSVRDGLGLLDNLPDSSVIHQVIHLLHEALISAGDSATGDTVEVNSANPLWDAMKNYLNSSDAERYTGKTTQLQKRLTNGLPGSLRELRQGKHASMAFFNKYPMRPEIVVIMDMLLMHFVNQFCEALVTNHGLEDENNIDSRVCAWLGDEVLFEINCAGIAVNCHRLFTTALIALLKLDPFKLSPDSVFSFEVVELKTGREITRVDRKNTFVTLKSAPTKLFGNESHSDTDFDGYLLTSDDYDVRLGNPEYMYPSVA